MGGARVAVVVGHTARLVAFKIRAARVGIGRHRWSSLAQLWRLFQLYSNKLDLAGLTQAATRDTYALRRVSVAFVITYAVPLVEPKDRQGGWIARYKMLS
jgi:hypothetical protein